jgi:acetylornithine deacetylase
MTSHSSSSSDMVLAAIDPDRLLRTAVALVDVPSPTRSAGAVADRLASILEADGFAVERPEADWPEAPAVVVRFDSGRPGRILQFDGHLDTVHLPFVPARIEDGNLYGSGASDMKGGIAAFVEALRVLRDHALLPGGAILLTAHDHHEGPWGDRRQLRALLRDGYRGDAVLLPEYLADRLPVAGRGSAIFEVTISRPGEPVHEVLRPPGTPDVIAAGAYLIRRLQQLHSELTNTTAPYVGHDSVFVGAIHAGQMFNQSPVQCTLSGARRWVTPGQTEAVLEQFRQLLANVAEETNTQIDVVFDLPGDAFYLDPATPIASAFQTAYTAVTGSPLPIGNKAFVDDGNIFAGEAGVPALTHGPAALGAHTVNEKVAVSELVRVAQVYVLTAINFCALP